MFTGQNLCNLYCTKHMQSLLDKTYVIFTGQNLCNVYWTKLTFSFLFTILFISRNSNINLKQKIYFSLLTFLDWAKLDNVGLSFTSRKWAVYCGINSRIFLSYHDIYSVRHIDVKIRRPSSWKRRVAYHNEQMILLNKVMQRTVDIQHTQHRLVSYHTKYTIPNIPHHTVPYHTSYITYYLSHIIYHIAVSYHHTISQHHTTSQHIKLHQSYITPHHTIYTIPYCTIPYYTIPYHIISAIPYYAIITPHLSSHHITVSHHIKSHQTITYITQHNSTPYRTQ